MAAKKPNIFVNNKKFRFLPKMRHFFGFFIVVQPNQGAQLKDRLF